MAKKKEESPKAETVVNSTVKLHNILEEYKTEHYNFGETVDWKISTGSLLLDTAIGGGLGPCLLRICGENNEGKSPSALEILRNFLKTVPNSKGFWLISEGRGLSKENRERCGLKFVSTAEEWVVGTVFLLESNVFELFIKCVKDLVLDNEENIRYCFVVDSVDGLQLRDDKAKEITENNKVAGVPVMSKKMFQSLSLGMFKFGHLMVFISQVTAEIKLDMHSKSANRGGNFSGGNTLLHAADWIFEFQKTWPSDYILDNKSKDARLNDGKSKSIGKWAKVLIVKAAVETARKVLVQYPIKFGRRPCGVWLEREMIDALLLLGLAEKKGPWFSFESSLLKEMVSNKIVKEDDKLLFQGDEKFLKYLEDNAHVVDFLFPKLVNYSFIVNEEKNKVLPEKTS